ncbi:MAG: VCBS repeat-containing protein, partial [Planctomycetales bacterium]|nr:VCBS repeat-containing protein [Planctomycetales bacterium]
LSSATTTGSELRIAGSYLGAANTYYRIEIFSNTAAELSGTGEGRTYLGYVNVPLDASGSVTGSYSLSTGVDVGAFISATATRTDSSYTTFYETSEFSNQVVAEMTQAIADSVSTNEDTPLVISPLDNDLGTPTLIEFTQPTNGSVVDNGNGTLTYTPNANYAGADSFVYAIADSADNLSHYWNFDGNANDSIGSSHGTLNGTTTVAGSVGNGLSFNESSDYVQIPDVTYGAEFTISFDFKLDDNSGSLFQYLYSHGDPNVTNSINVFINEASHATDPNVMRTVIRDGDDTIDNFALQFDISAIVGDGQWHTYTATVGAGGIKVYLDGALKMSDATRGTGGVNPTGSVYLGARMDLAADRYFGGSLDSLRIYDSSLTTSQVTALDASSTATVSISVNAVNDAPNFFATGAGGFGGTNLIASDGTAATSVATGDFDGDGDLDVVAANQNTDAITWYESDGSGNFIASHTVSLAVDGPMSVYVSDLDGDGDLDVLSASLTDNQIAWFENDGSGSFITHSITTTASGATGVAATDLDHDGDIDILASASTDSVIYWFENDGSENFTTHILATGASAARMVTFADVNQDGYLDVLTASYADDTIAWYENDGSQNFTEHAVTITADGARYVQAIDLDQDGDIDLVGSSGLNDELFWFENDGNESFTKHVLSLAYGDVWALQVADLDLDGDLDIAFTDFANTSDVVWLANDGSQNFSINTIATGIGNPNAIAVADIDNDGDLDVLTTSWSGGDVNWYENFARQSSLDGNPTFVEGGAAVVLDANVEIFDQELSSADEFNGATLTLARNGGANAEDQLAFDGITVTTSGSNVLVSGTQVGTYSFTGGQLIVTFGANATQARVNTLMQNIVYWNSSDAPPSSVNIAWTFDDGNTGDQGSGGNLTATGSTTVNITAVNDAPTNAGSLPTDITVTEDVLSDIDLSAIDLSDLDHNGGILTLKLSTDVGGRITAAAMAGITIGTNGTDYVTLDGTLADLNTYLNTASNLKYLHPTANVNGNDADIIYVTVTDNGNTGTGGGGNISLGAVNVDITSVNDEEVLATNTGTTINEASTGNVITTAMLETTDVDNTAAQLTYTITTATGNGTLRLSGTALGVSDTFTQADIDAGDVTYDHDGSETVSDSFSFNVDDGAGTNSSGTFSITVTPVNDEEVLATNTGTTVNEASTGNVITTAILHSTDVDNSAAQLTYTITTATGNGTLRLSGTALLISDTFTQADIDAGLVTYDHDGSETVSDSFSFTVDDGAGTNTSGTFSITVTPVNDEEVLATNTG